MQVQLTVTITAEGHNDVEITKAIEVGSISIKTDPNVMKPILDYDVSSILHDMSTAASSVWRAN